MKKYAYLILIAASGWLAFYKVVSTYWPYSGGEPQYNWVIIGIFIANKMLPLLIVMTSIFEVGKPSIAGISSRFFIAYVYTMSLGIPTKGAIMSSVVITIFSFLISFVIAKKQRVFKNIKWPN